MSTVLTRVKPAASQATGDGGPAWPSASAATVGFSSTSGVYPRRPSSSSSPPSRWWRHTRPATQAMTPASAARPTRRVAQRAAEHERRHRPAPSTSKTISAPDIALSPVAAGPVAPHSTAAATGAMLHRAGRPSSRPPVRARPLDRVHCASAGIRVEVGAGWHASLRPCACTMGRNRLRRVDTAMSGLTGGYGVGEGTASGSGRSPQDSPLKGLTSAARARSIMSAEPPSRRAAGDECVRRRAAPAPRSGLPA